MATAAVAAGNQLAQIRKSIDVLLGDVGGLLADLTSPTEGADDEENEQARRVIDVELQRFWQGYYELKRRHDENSLSVAVLALTKSGKSTLLNSLMGMEVLPMNNVPETARIVRITHDATAREPVLHDGTNRPAVRGEAAVRARLQELNSAARTHRSGSGVLSPQSSGSLAAAGSGATADSAAAAGGGEAFGAGTGAGGSPGGGGAGRASGSILQISAPLVALEGFGPEFGRVTLLDTPGPNEAGEEQLKYQVERLLEGVDCVLYLLDYTKLKTAEEEGLFRRLRAINPQLVARLSSRLFFVINKVDASETSEGLDPDEVRNYVAELVTRQLGGPPAPTTRSAGQQPSPPGSPAFSSAGSSRGGPDGSGSGTGSCPPPPPPFRLHPDQVLLLAARNALLARLVLGGRAGQDAARRFQRLAFGAFGGGGMMGLGGRGGAPVGPSNEQLRAAAGCLLEGSGVPELEGRVLAFLAAHAGSVKALAAADDLTRLLAQIRNVALTCCSCLHRNAAALQQQADQLRAELASAREAFEAVRQRTDAVTAEVVSEIKSHLNTLRRRLFTHIVQTLDTDARAPPPAAASGAAAGGSGAATGWPGAAFTRSWARVREKFLSVFTATTPNPLSARGPESAGSGSGGCGPSLVPEARSRSREELQALLLELHDDLMGQIHSEVYDFWGVLEACAASRHSELLAALNTHLAALSRRVEGAVSGALQVELAPADLRLRPPSAEQLHSDVQELIEKGIRESTEKHIRVGTRTCTERVLRQPVGPPSLCRWGGYWEEVPRTRTVVESYTATVYSLKPDEIANHFIGLVDGAVTASERALATHVGALVERQLAAAREQLAEYGDRYLTAVTAALSVSSRGAEFRCSALAAVEGYLARLDELAARAQGAQAAAEAAVPGGAAGLMDEVQVYDDEEDEEAQEGGQEEGREVVEVDAVVPEAGALAAAAEPETEDAGGDGGAAPAAPARTASWCSSSPEDIDDVMGAAEAACDGEAEGVALDVTAEPQDEVAAVEEEGVVVEAEEQRDVAPQQPESAGGSGGVAALVAPAKAEAMPSMQLLGEAGLEEVGAAQEPASAAAAAPEAPAAPEEEVVVPQAAGELVAAVAAPSVMSSEGEAVATAAAAAAASASAPRLLGGPTSVSGGLLGLSGLSSSGIATAPFDYGRAFLEAMSSSEMMTPLEPWGHLEGEGEGVLTMIPLTADGGETRPRDPRSGPLKAVGGADGPVGHYVVGMVSESPRSGTSEEWQLVDEGEAGEVGKAAGEAGSKVAK